MTSFNYHLSSIYAIKECPSCGGLYTSNCGCSKGILEDKILVPIPDSSQRPFKIEKICLDCGDPIHGLYCQECALIRKTFEEVFQDLQDTSESSDDNTNVVNAPREPFVVKHDPGENSSPSLPQIDHCCHECGDSLDGIFCRQCTCKFCEKGAHYGGPHETFQCRPMNEDYYHEQNSCYDSNSFGFDQVQPPQYTVNHPIFNSQNELLNSSNKLMEQMTTLCDLVGQAIQKKEEEKQIAKEQAAKDRYWKIPIFYDDDEDDTIIITPVLPIEEPVNSLSMGDKHLDTIPETESDKFIKSSVKILVQIPSESEGIPDKMCDVPLCKNTTPLNALNEHYEIVVNSNDDNSSSDDDSTYGEDIDYVDASPPHVEIVSLEEVEIVDPKVGGVDDDILLTIKDDILREKLLNVNLLIAKIDALRDNPTPSSDVVIKSTSTFSNLFLEETNTFDNSIPESETFRFNLEEISSGSPTTHSELSLPDYKAFYVDNDHFKERSSGSTTTHVDFSQYDSFISNDQFPPTDRSDLNHEEFADELAHIISPSEYDHFCFKIEPELGNLTMDVVNDIFPTREPRVHVPNVLPTHPTLDTDFILLSEPLFAYIVWIFLPFLTYPVAPPYLLSCGNEDIIFDPGISMYHSFMPDVSHRSGTFMKFNVYPNHLNESPMDILSSTCSPMDQRIRGRVELVTQLTKTRRFDFSDCDDSRARGFVLHSQELHILSFILEIRYSNLIDKRTDISQKVETTKKKKRQNRTRDGKGLIMTTRETSFIKRKKGEKENEKKKDVEGLFLYSLDESVAQGYTQEEGIDYDEVYSPVARIEAIRLFLAYASFKDFVVYKMNVKSAFIYGKIEEEVYVCQPPGFEDPDFANRVYKVENALYGLHQAPRAWYETLLTYLLDNEFQRGKIDTTLFIRRDKCDILLVQVYVDGIIFGSTKKSLCIKFEKMMHKKFQMSSMGALTFFLGLQYVLVQDSKSFYTISLLMLGIGCLEWNEKAAKDEIRFWDTIKAKTVNGEVQLQALVDKKKEIASKKRERKILDIDADEDITLDSTHFDTDPDMFGVHDLDGDEVFVETEELVVNTATTTSTIPVSAAKDLSDVDITLAQALAELKNTKLNAVTIAAITTTTKGLVIQEQEQASTPITSSKDKEAIKLQAQFDKEARIAEKRRSNAAFVAQWNVFRDKRSLNCSATLREKRKFFAAKRREEKRNRPPTKAQQRSIMCTYLKNMEGWKPKDLKNKSFVNIQELFEKAMKMVNTFVDFRTKLVEDTEREASSKRDETIGQESSLKRAGDELEQEKAKKQKIDDDQ
ncbi:reverse transcriptase domain-containing protein [Tanacetum coccineum]